MLLICRGRLIAMTLFFNHYAIVDYYAIVASVLLENNQWHILHIHTSEDIIDRFLHWIYIIYRKLHGGLKIWILSSRDENNILLIRYAHS